MKTKLLVKLTVVLALCIAVLCAFTACKDDEVYAGSDDFQSYPDYWNDFNKNTGDIYIPSANGGTINSQGGSDADAEDNSSDDFTANFTEDDEKVLTGNNSGSSGNASQNNSNKENTDSSNEGSGNSGNSGNESGNESDNESDNSSSNPDYGNQGPLVFF